MSERQSGLELARWIAHTLDKKGGKNIRVLDVRNLSSITDFLVIGSGTSSKHLETLVDAPTTELKKLGFPPLHIEGKSTGWIVADCNDIVLHIFDEPTRTHFDLEGLWHQAGDIDWDLQSKRSLIAL